MLHSEGTNCPVALDRQDEVRAKLKTKNPSLDTSIRILYLNKVTNEWIQNVPAKTLKAGRYRKEKLIIFLTINPVTEKFQRLQTLIISSHKWLRCQAYRTK
ncbi:hypothetical protein Tco_0879190, partial [Tanacetum coccineum]